MKNTLNLVLAAALMISTLAGQSAMAQSNASSSQRQTITAVIDGMLETEGGYLIRRPNNGGKALEIANAMDFSAEQIDRLKTSLANRTTVKLVIEGKMIVDIL